MNTNTYDEQTIPVTQYIRIKDLLNNTVTDCMNKLLNDITILSNNKLFQECKPKFMYVYNETGYNTQASLDTDSDDYDITFNDGETGTTMLYFSIFVEDGQVRVEISNCYDAIGITFNYVDEKPYTEYFTDYIKEYNKEDREFTFKTE